MPQFLAKIIAHIVFSTKNRTRIITPEIEPQLFGYIGGIIRNNDARMIAAGGTSDHIHLLVSIGHNDVGELIGDIKRNSSLWVKNQSREFGNFYWQRGYGAFSIGQSQVPSVSGHIRDQKEHHQKKNQTYEDEFRELSPKYEVEFDERYCWD